MSNEMRGLCGKNWTRRWDLLHKWQDYLRNAASPSIARALPSQTVCNRLPFAFGKGYITVASNGESSSLQGVVYCDNAWSCPVCAPKVLRQHARKIAAIIKARDKLQQSAFMVTLTVPHYRDQSAAEVLGIVRETSRAMYCGGFSRWRKRYGWRGRITSTECTYGGNGFHFHQHILVFIDNEHWDDVPMLVAKLDEYWRNAYKRCNGRFDGEWTEFAFDSRYGCHLSVNNDGTTMKADVGSYVAGWGADDELTGSTVKKSGGKSMWELLDGTDFEKSKFAEYALATKYRQRISYSNNLQKGIEAELAEIEADDENYMSKKSEPVCSFKSDDWFEVLSAEEQAPVIMEILIAACTGYESVCNVCRQYSIPLPYRPHELDIIITEVWQQTA